MKISILLREFKKGLKETSKYVFSHHKKEDYYKCYFLNLKKRQIVICSRCLGVYIGIILGTTLFYLQVFDITLYYFSIAFFPLLTVIDWSISAFTKYKSTNFFRTSFGLMLGVAYAFGVILFFKTFPNYFIISIGIFYIILTYLLIQKKNKYPKKITDD